MILLNVGSLAKHLNDIVHDYRCLKSDGIRITETHIWGWDSTSIIDDTHKDFNMNFNNNGDKILSLAYGCQNHVLIIRKFVIYN